MKKRKKLLPAALLAALLLSGCSSSKGGAGPGGSDPQETQSPEKDTVQTLSITEFENLLSQQPLYVASTDYVVQDDTYKTLYPDMLSAVLQNNTNADIKDAVVAFAAWDSSNLPVKITGQIDFTDGDYIRQVDYSDINLAAGGTFGENSGFSLGEDCKVSTFKAIAVSFETFDGETWKNPYYKAFCKLYEGQKYSDDLTVEVKPVENTFPAAESTETDSAPAQSPAAAMSAAELEANLSTQPVTVIRTDYVVQDDTYKALYPDMLSAVLQNNTDTDIKNAVVAFAAWDSSNLPVKITGEFEFTSGDYIKRVDYNDINLAAGGTFGENSGFSLNEDCQISTFKAIVVSYETFDGEIWKNPYYNDFCKLYKGQKLIEN